MPGLSPLRRGVYASIPSLLCVLLIATVYVYLTSDSRARKRGQELNLTAWERSYVERGLPVPAGGPRCGYWGAKLRPMVKMPGIGWYTPEHRLKGVLEVDARGMQHYESSARDPARVLIIGGSTAFASYSSSIETSYFHLLGEALESRGIPVRIDVFACGAWKAKQEVRALEMVIEEIAPDLVVHLNGLNDLTVGVTSEALFEDEAEPAHGSRRGGPRHAGDYERRVTDYLRLLREAAGIARAHGSELLVVLQPSLLERRPPSAFERRVVRGSLKHLGPIAVLRESYQRMREGLRALEAEGQLSFLDASQAFNREKFTTFADMYHFGDVGHQILADSMLDAVAAGLERSRTAGAPARLSSAAAADGAGR